MKKTNITAKKQKKLNSSACPAITKKRLALMQNKTYS